MIWPISQVRKRAYWLIDYLPTVGFEEGELRKGVLQHCASFRVRYTVPLR